MKEKRGGDGEREWEGKRGGGERESNERQREKGEGSYQEVFNDQLREPK